MSYLVERRLEEKERRRFEILDAAETVAKVVGIGALTMDQVARKARLSRALVYVYFRAKADLLIAISIRALEQLNGRFVDVLAQPLRGAEQVEACGRAYANFARECPVRFEVLAQFEAHSLTGDLDPAYEEFLRVSDRAHAALTRAIENGLKDGSIRNDLGNPALLGLTLWGLMHGIIQLTMHKIGRLQRSGISAESLVEHGLRLALDALSHAPSIRA